MLTTRFDDDVRSASGSAGYLLAAWAVAVVILPIYVFGSGRPQYADFLLAGLSVIVLAAHGPVRDRNRRQAMAILLAFVGWVWLVNGFWFAVLGSSQFLISASFYLFNFLVVHTALRLYELCGVRFLEITFSAVLVSLLILVVVAFTYSSSARTNLTFNNPNQLAYFCVASASIICLLGQLLGKSREWIWFLLFICAYLVLLSVSRSGAVGVVAAAALYSLQGSRNLLLFLLISLPAFFLVGELDTTAAVTERFERDEDLLGASQAEIRGYDRIWRFPQYLLFGAGEGAYHRFSPLALEMHSSLGTILFAYGIPGAAIFLLLFGRLASETTLRSFLLLAPSFLYGLHHQGLRSRAFWILTALIVLSGTLTRTRQPDTTAGRTPFAGGKRVPAWAPRRVRLGRQGANNAETEHTVRGSQAERT